MEIIVYIFGIIVSFLVGYFLQKLKNRPQPISHKCRLAEIDVYTYFDSSNKPSKPACILLTPEGDCKLLKGESNIDPAIKESLSFHKGKCYLAQWNK